jgi:SAM-dependent methyltransferase
VDVPDPPAEGSRYAEIGVLQGAAYHRNAFARGTEQEADVLAEVLALPAGSAVLDVGCGDGRHVGALRRRGLAALGLDLAPAVLAGGRARDPGRPLVAGRAQALPFADGSVDGLVSVCQGGFGLQPAQDVQAVTEWSRVVRTGGSVALSAFSLVFASRYMAVGDALDVGRALHHHVADVRDGDGGRHPIDLWTALYSVPHLVHLLGHHGFDVLGVAGVEPGAYQCTRPPTVADPEVLVWAERR